MDAQKYSILRNMAEPPTRRISGGPARGAAGSGEACAACHFWLPHSLNTRIGLCENPSSRHFSRPTFDDKPAGDCFIPRSFAGVDFFWCETHRTTIHSSELSDHSGCRVFVGSARLPVEDEMELTLSGD